MRFVVDPELCSMLRMRYDESQNVATRDFEAPPVIRSGLVHYFELCEFVLHHRDPRYKLYMETAPQRDREQIKISYKNGNPADCRLCNIRWTPHGTTGAMMRNYARRAPR